MRVIGAPLLAGKEMKIHRLPRPSDRIVEIRTRRTRKLLARFNLSTGVLEIQRQSRLYRIRLDEIVDNGREIVYTETVGN